MFTELMECPEVLESVTCSDAPEQSRVFVSIDAAIEELRAGRMIVVVDDEDRENEGDLTMAAESAAARRKVLGRVLRRFRDRRLYDRGGLSNPSSSGSALLSARHGNRLVQAHQRHGADLLDQSRPRTNAI